ncbi:MAG: hypothetical protein AABY07_03740 [Nanoarchaeota archaeon]
MSVNPIYILGFGGLAREIYNYVRGYHNIAGFINNIRQPNYLGIPVYTDYDARNFISRSNIIVGIGSIRKKEIIDQIIPQIKIDKILTCVADCDFCWCENIGMGSVIALTSFVSCNVNLGKFCLINYGSTIGHDTTIGDYFTASPGSRISGNCRIGNNVYFGANSVILENLSVCDNTIIGAGAVVTKDITEPGTYVGTPARKIKNG